MKLALSCVISVLLSGCSSQKAPTDTRQPQPDQPLIKTAESAILRQLRDPSSAQFRDVYANSKGIVCGSVNARSIYGGYVGFSAFWYDPKTGEAFIYNPDQGWSGKGYDARLFILKGCSIGSDEQRALAVAPELDASNKRLGIEPFAPKSS